MKTFLRLEYNGKTYETEPKERDEEQTKELEELTERAISGEMPAIILKTDSHDTHFPKSIILQSILTIVRVPADTKTSPVAETVQPKLKFEPFDLETGNYIVCKHDTGQGFKVGVEYQVAKEARPNDKTIPFIYRVVDSKKHTHNMSLEVVISWFDKVICECEKSNPTTSSPKACLDCGEPLS